MEKGVSQRRNISQPALVKQLTTQWLSGRIGQIREERGEVLGLGCVCVCIYGVCICVCACGICVCVCVCAFSMCLCVMFLCVCGLCVCACVCMCLCVMCLCVCGVYVVYVVCLCICMCVKGSFISWLGKKEEGSTTCLCKIMEGVQR